MKRFLSIALLLMMLLSLAACGGDTSAGDSSEGSAPAGELFFFYDRGYIVIYTGCGPEITDPILELFRETYPDINVEIIKAGSGELMARIRAALRKRPAAPADAPLLTCGSLVMDVERHTVEVDGRGVELTRREFDLLHYLLENKGKVISRESLLDNVWGFDFVGEPNAVDVYIRFLRSKIDEQFGVKLIHTVRGVGYVIREE